MKMIGVISDRRRWRMSAAVSNPSMIGMRTSSRMTAKSCAMTHRKRGHSGVGLDDRVAERRQHRLECQSLRRIVVDHEDRDGALVGHRTRTGDVDLGEHEALMPWTARSPAAMGRGPRGAPPCRPASGRSRWLRPRGSAGARRATTLPVTAMIGSVSNASIARMARIVS